MTSGERWEHAGKRNQDGIAIRATVYFSTFNPTIVGSPSNLCSNPVRCDNNRGTARFYSAAYSNGDPVVGSDRGETQLHASFLTNPVIYSAEDQSSHIIYTSDNEVKINLVPGGIRTSLKDWEEDDRPR